MSAVSIRYRQKKKRRLREGFTTGTAAAAAVKSALQLLLTNSPLDPIPVTLPEGKNLRLPLHRDFLDGGVALCSVIKDGGDDPDVTHGAEVGARVRILGDPEGTTEIVFKAGEGVGEVTKPGLPIRVGQPAINPVPRQMIRWAVEEVLEVCGPHKPQRVEVEVFVTGGETLAKKTLNPRLGILGGISILGTTKKYAGKFKEAIKEDSLTFFSCEQQPPIAIEELLDTCLNIYSGIKDYTCVLHKTELVDNTIIEENDIIFKFKKPKSFFLRWPSGSEAIFVQDRYDNKLKFM